MAQKKWSREMIIGRIKELKDQNIALSSRNIFKNHISLYSAACSYFGGWANAVWIAGVNYDEILNQGKLSRREKLSKWSRARVLEEIQKILSLNPSANYKDQPALYAAARREFRSWKDAVKEAGYLIQRKPRAAKAFYTLASKENAMEKEFGSGSVLIVDDDLFDCFLINKAIKANGVENHVRFFEDGQALMDHLNENLKTPSPDQVSELPSLIVMDINMPRLNGHETLKILKANSQLKEIPVVILTSSSAPEDIDHSYQAGANSFFSKPPDYVGLVGIMRLLKNDWLQKSPLSQAGA
jgi:two-component system, response regulator